MNKQGQLYEKVCHLCIIISLVRRKLKQLSQPKHYTSETALVTLTILGA